MLGIDTQRAIQGTEQPCDTDEADGDDSFIYGEKDDAAAEVEAAWYAEHEDELDIE